MCCECFARHFWPSLFRAIAVEALMRFRRLALQPREYGLCADGRALTARVRGSGIVRRFPRVRAGVGEPVARD